MLQRLIAVLFSLFLFIELSFAIEEEKSKILADINSAISREQVRMIYPQLDLNDYDVLLHLFSRGWELEIFATNPNFNNNSEQIYKIIKLSKKAQLDSFNIFDLLPYISRQLKSDRDFMMQMHEIHPATLQFASKRLLADKVFFDLIVSKNLDSKYFFHNILRDELVLANVPKYFFARVVNPKGAVIYDRPFSAASKLNILVTGHYFAVSNQAGPITKHANKTNKWYKLLNGMWVFGSDVQIFGPYKNIYFVKNDIAKIEDVTERSYYLEIILDNEDPDIADKIIHDAYSPIGDYILSNIKLFKDYEAEFIWVKEKINNFDKIIYLQLQQDNLQASEDAQEKIKLINQEINDILISG
jgi:hypothetical protein